MALWLRGKPLKGKIRLLRRCQITQLTIPWVVKRTMSFQKNQEQKIPKPELIKVSNNNKCFMN